MRLALFAARSADPFPNPRVGAIVAMREDVISVAHHQRAGEAHAEVLALEAAGLYARGATLYVTLEPCNHWGKTPPCVDAILRAGVRRVVYGCADPNPHVTGGGVELLRRHGVVVDSGPWQRRAQELIADWRARLPC
jgi:diaminohydroxyphosphoribosylaminopyrimidine deaminase/5-amino-6-(5-phosphoribosylamino)uracil reductase